MFIDYPNFSKLVGYDCKNKEKPLYLLKDVQIKIISDETKIVIIPKGFTSDGCTLKTKILKAIFGCEHTPEYVPASIVHDNFCTNKEFFQREEATEVFKIMLISEGVELKKAKQMAFWMNLYQKYIKGWK